MSFYYEFLVLGKMLVNLSKRNDEKCPNIFLKSFDENNATFLKYIWPFVIIMHKIVDAIPLFLTLRRYARLHERKILAKINHWKIQCNKTTLINHSSYLFQWILADYLPQYLRFYIIWRCHSEQVWVLFNVRQFLRQWCIRNQWYLRFI